jgi:hypothetical protein
MFRRRVHPRQLARDFSLSLPDDGTTWSHRGLYIANKDGPMPTEAATDSAINDPRTTEIEKRRPQLAGFLKHSADAAEAQLAMWKLEMAITLLRAVIAVIAGLVLLALGIYGFVLLDDAANVAIATHAAEPWVSPLVRGALYFLFPAVLLFPLVKSALAATKVASDACEPENPGNSNNRDGKERANVS